MNKNRHRRGNPCNDDTLTERERERERDKNLMIEKSSKDIPCSPFFFSQVLLPIGFHSFCV
jgi:hypothetical protein